MARFSTEGYIPTAPNGVWLEQGVLKDSTLGQEYPVNQSAAMLLSLADGRRSIREIVRIIACEMETTEGEVVEGALGLFWKLNASYLLNFRNQQIYDEIRAVAATLFKAIGSATGTPQVNHRISLTGLWRTDLALFLRVLWLTFRAPGLLMVLVFGGPAVAMGYGLVLTGLMFVFLLAIFLHELGHILALRTKGYGTHDLGLVATPGSVFVIRRPASDDVEIVVGMAGPVLSASVGGLLLGGYWLLGWDWAVAAAFPFLLQSISLAPVFDDNKVLKRALVVGVHTITNFRSGGLVMSNEIRWLMRLVMTIVGVYMLLIVLSLAVSIGADMAGASSFSIGSGDFMFYTFTKESEGFHGGLGGGAFWTAVIISVASVWLAQRRSGKSMRG